MGHALTETWRILRPGGQLIDLRPLASEWLVEVVTQDGVTLAGRIDQSPWTPNVVAADQAIAEAVERGWFTKKSRATFQYNYYWDTAEEMQTYIEANWASVATLPDSVRAKASHLISLAAGPVQIRVQRTMLVASYYKLAAGPNEANTVRVRVASGTASISSNAVSAWEK